MAKKKTTNNNGATMSTLESTLGLSKPEAATLPLKDIVVDHLNLQVRVAMDEEVVEDYHTAYKQGEKFPPLVLFRISDNGSDMNDVHLVSGFTRYDAAVEAKVKEHDCLIYTGTMEQAVKYSASANKTNGQRLSPSDKARALDMILDVEEAKPKAQRMSDRDIARLTGFSHTGVSKHRLRREDPEAYRKKYIDKQEENGRHDDEPQAAAPEPSGHTPSGVKTPATVGDLKSETWQEIYQELIDQRPNIASFLAVLKTAHRYLKDRGSEMWELINEKQEIEDLHEMIEPLITHVESNMPGTLCPYCYKQSNQPRVNCKACDGYGWVTEPVRQAIPPEELVYE